MSMVPRDTYYDGTPGYLVFRDLQSTSTKGHTRDVHGIPGYLVCRDLQSTPTKGCTRDVQDT